MPPCRIDADYSGFRNEVKSACKRHRSLNDELRALLFSLEQDYERGDRIPNLGLGVHVRKIRVGVPKERIPSSHGYRLVLQIIEGAPFPIGRCLSLYYKPDRANLSTKVIAQLIRAAAAQRGEKPES